MKLLRQIDTKTRIVFGYYFPALGFVIKLQRKRFWGWRTVSWIYPEIVEAESKEYVEYWLFWNEGHNGKNSIKIAEKIFSKTETL